ncbi:hypothetical protein CMUS01_15608 [Colletotrichum musicola]|uniref:Uncharacterized protein n=1 Tax=Colletotrichum musicola TaxID=2175873 RepID=A0A8H6MLV0_9PEZI|nr:hypothetical protein CMUS01_15608 [Colletotrichum musicola]
MTTASKFPPCPSNLTGASANTWIAAKMGIFRRFFGILTDSSNHASADGIMGVHFKDAVSTFDRMTQEANLSYENMTPRGSHAAPKQSKATQKASIMAILQKTIPTTRVARQNATKNTEMIKIPKLRQPLGSQETTSIHDAPSRVHAFNSESGMSSQATPSTHDKLGRARAARPNRQPATLYHDGSEGLAPKASHNLHQENGQEHVRSVSSSTAASNLSSSSCSSNRTLKKKNRVKNLASIYQTHSRQTSSSSTECSDWSAAHDGQVVLKKKNKGKGLAKVYRDQERKTTPTHKRIRSVSTTQVSSSGSVFGSEESVLVTFPSFELAGKSKCNIQEVLAIENQLAKHRDVEGDDAEWGLDPAALDGGICTKRQHENIITYEAYSAQDVIQQIYNDLPERESPGFATSAKRAENLLFGNYKHGIYKKISPGGPLHEPKKAGAWSFKALREFVSRVFWKAGTTNA